MLDSPPQTELLIALPEPALLLDSGGRIIDANDRAAALLETAAADLRGHGVEGILKDAGALEAWLAAPGRPEDFRGRGEASRSSGVPVTVDLSARRLDPHRAICLLRELSEERLAGEAQLYFDVAFETAPIGMALFNTDGEYIRVNAALCDLLGRGADELLGRRDQEFTHPDDRQADVDAAWRFLRGEVHTWQCEKRFLRPGGGVVWAIANLTFLRSPDGHPLSWVGQFQDITERRLREAHLQDLADRDPLTGVFNRRCLEERLEGLMEEGRGGAIVLLDLDRFKEINDLHGHRAGDLVLVGVASALLDTLRGDDLVARLGGDEFALLLPDAGGENAQTVLNLVTEVVGAQSFPFDPAVTISASVGMAAFGPGRPTDAAGVLAAADAAMYRAKGRAGVRRGEWAAEPTGGGRPDASGAALHRSLEAPSRPSQRRVPALSRHEGRGAWRPGEP